MATTDQRFLQALQSMFAQMATEQQSNTEALGELIKNMPKAGNADSGGLWRGLEAPSVFDGKDIEWKATKLRTRMLTREPEAGTYLTWAETSVEKIYNFAIFVRFTNASFDDERVLMFSRELHLQLQSCTSPCGGRLGLEAWRVLSARFQPRTPGTKRAVLRAIFEQQLPQERT